MLLITLSQIEYHSPFLMTDYYNFSLMIPIRINNFRGTKIIRKNAHCYNLHFPFFELVRCKQNLI